MENSVFIGLVVPGETILLAASFYAARGDFDIILVILYGALGAVIGNNVGYYLGLKGGRPFIERFGRRFFISDARIKAAENYFDSHGGKTVFIGRFVSGIRVFVSPLAGAARMSFGKFLLYTVLAVLSWTIGMGILGYVFGQNWDLLLKIIERIGWVALGFVLILLVGAYLFRRKRKREFLEQDK
jgi:membrane protein DedA with SNARE-associated domain